MKMLHTLCISCGEKLGLTTSLLSVVYDVSCEGCGIPVGYCSKTSKVLGDYYHFWQREAWPIMFGIAVQDFVGMHVHQWSRYSENFVTGERRESCRCKEKRTLWLKDAS